MRILSRSDVLTEHCFAVLSGSAHVGYGHGSVYGIGLVPAPAGAGDSSYGSPRWDMFGRGTGDGGWGRSFVDDSGKFDIKVIE